MRFISYRYLPLNAYLAFALFTVCALIFGPVVYEGLDYLSLLSFLVAFLLLFTFGYMVGAQGRMYQGEPQRSQGVPQGYANYFRIRRFVRVFLLLGFLVSIAYWISFYLGSGTLDVSKMGESYTRSYEDYVRGQAKVDATYIASIAGRYIVLLAVLFGISYYRNFGKWASLVLIFIISTYLLVNVVGSGKQKYVGDIVVFMASILVIRMAQQKRRVRMKHFFGGLAAASAVFFVFVEILRQRYAALGIGFHNIDRVAHPLMLWDRSSFLVRILGEDYGFPVGAFLSYFSNGLYGLSLCLQLPFQWTYFAGNSYALSRVVEIVSGSAMEITERTYPFRAGIEYGWGLSKWHSLFPWLASDITFIGVLVITPFFSAFYARLWQIGRAHV